MRPTPARTLLPNAAALALALVAAGCAKEPSAHSCSTHADCPSGTTCQAGVCQDGLVLELTAPAAATTYANAAVPCTVTVTGLVPGAVRLVVDDVALETLVAPFSGSLPIAGLSEGSHRLVATADLGGRTYVSPPRTIVVDRVAPAAPAVAPATTGAADPVTVGGTWTTDSGAPVTLTVYEGATVKASGIVPGVGGVWSAGVSLGEGTHQLTATATDAAGNTSSASAAATIVVDRTAPPVPAVTAAVTNAANPVAVQGTIAADAGTPVTITVFEGATVMQSGIVPSGGTWSASFPLGEGSHALTARAVDAAGNLSAPSSPAAVVVDRTLPAAPAVTAAYTNAADPVPVSGTLTPDGGAAQTISVYEGASLRASGIVPSGSAWTTALTLSEGSHSLTARAVDGAGNPSNPSSAATVWVDRTNPAAPAVNAATTNSANPVTVTGTWTTADTGSPVTIAVYEGATQLASGVTPSGGAWSAAVTLSEASHGLTARAVDAAGNQSGLSGVATVVVDRTLPPVPTINALTTNAANPVTVSGTIATDGGTAVTVRVYEGLTELRAGVVPSGTSWTTTVTLGEGTHSLTVRSFDAAGNQSGLSSAANVVVDRTVPATPTVTSTRTNQANPVTVSGTWVTNDTGTPVTITVYEGATVLASGVVPAAGAWSAAFPLSETTHSITARAFDAAGNQSALSAAGTIIVDRTAPTVTGRTPGINATGVWSRDNVVVTFSEPVQSGTINGTNVRVSSVSPAFDVAFSWMNLSGGGTTLTLIPDATALPPVPSHVTITLSGILDLAGNALPTTTWSWDYPDWVDAAPSFRGNYYGVRHAWSASNAGVLYDATPDGFSGTHVSSSTAGGAWTGLGQITTSSSNQPGIAVDSQGRPVVATAEGGTIVVRRYAAGTWGQLGTITTTGTSRPLVAIDSLDRPVVLWNDGTDVVAGYRWSGSDWSTQLVPGRSSNGSGVYALVVKSNDTGASAFLTAGGSLAASDVTLSRNVGAVAGVAMTQGSNNDDYVAYVTTPGTVGVVTKLNAYPASSLTDFGPTMTAYATTSPWAPGIAYRNVGPTTSRLFLAFRSTTNRPVVYAWDGTSSWASITGSLGTTAGAVVRDVELFATPAGQLYVGWWEIQNADYYALFLKRYNR